MQNLFRHFVPSTILLTLLLGLVAVGSSAQSVPSEARSSLLKEQQGDRGQMAGYRAVAKLAYESFQKGDLMASARLADTLETFWSHYEEPRPEKSSPEKFRPVDQAMDDFVKPLIAHQERTPDPAGVRAAYEEYLQNLKLID